MKLSAPPLIPSYGQGFNRFAADPHLMGDWSPFVGATGATLYDKAKPKNHGVLHMPVTQWGTCQHGTYLDLDGANDRVDIPNAMDNAAQPQTFMAWIRPDDITHRGYLLSCHTGVGGTGVICEMAGVVNGDMQFLVFSDGAPAAMISRTNGILVQDVWQQVAYVWDGTLLAAGVRFFRNGTLQAKANPGQNGGGAALPATGAWAIGGRLADDLRNYDGKFFMAAWWDYMLSESEIQLLHHDPHYLLREVD